MEHIVQGRRLDPDLDSTGTSQAAALGAALSRVPLVAVYSSPLLRARVTADAIAARQAAPSPRLVSDALNEVDFGEVDGVRQDVGAALLARVYVAWAAGAEGVRAGRSGESLAEGVRAGRSGESLAEVSACAEAVHARADGALAQLLSAASISSSLDNFNYSIHSDALSSPLTNTSTSSGSIATLASSVSYTGSSGGNSGGSISDSSGGGGSAVAAVSHSSMIKATLSRVLRAPLERVRALGQDNCGVNVLDWDATTGVVTAIAINSRPLPPGWRG
ncbi:histidine phosphatase superfamily [Tribonema minus]|uniref:Histidine phosphatase superfamily n=1 Tax=Tribonema minus TaxID=303371 RepID=A0A835Z4W9_9STRA|nr:histidine phosphatase superfamily [Tribonema minus]